MHLAAVPQAASMLAEIPATPLQPLPLGERVQGEGRG